MGGRILAWTIYTPSDQHHADIVDFKGKTEFLASDGDTFGRLGGGRK